MRPPALRRPTYFSLAWTLIALLWVAGWAVWLFPHRFTDLLLGGWVVLMVPSVLFALMVARAQQRWILGVAACLTVIAPVILIFAAFLIFGVT